MLQTCNQPLDGRSPYVQSNLLVRGLHIIAIQVRQDLAGCGRGHERDAESEDDGADACGEERKRRRRQGALASAGDQARSQGRYHLISKA